MNTNFYADHLEFYACNVCGNLMIKLNDSGLTPQCCGRDMEKLTPNTVDADGEKHVPYWKMEGCKVMVTVGKEPHPMEEAHYIQWIVVETNKGYYAKHLSPTSEPAACFKMCKEETVTNVYAYCNIHKLWLSNSQEDQYECPLCGI